MSRLALLAAVAMSAMLPGIGNANPVIEATSNCLTDSTTGRDRKELVKWIFVSISKHPEITALANYSPEQSERISRNVGKLFTRLIAEDCGKEIRAMVAAEGPDSISTAFEVLGRVAMVELMSHPDVGAALGSLADFTDQEKIQKSLSATSDAK